MVVEAATRINGAETARCFFGSLITYFRSALGSQPFNGCERLKREFGVNPKLFP